MHWRHTLSHSPHHYGQLRLFLLLSNERGHQFRPRLHKGGDEARLCAQLLVVGGDSVPKSLNL